ncbi:MAG: molybdopterin-dependent oxidoreductase, partial [Thermoprotei archaeon]|nr:molybdopterin-dependent oxidoreductase [Thermoprotei archaeon]
MWALSLRARRKGSMIAVIDPRRSEAAEGADIWLRPRPGTDVALALGVIRYIIEHGYIERDFIDEWTYGYELFKEEIMKWTPERVEEVAGVRWDISYITGEALSSVKSDVASQVSLSEHIKRGDFKFIYVYNMNPAITLPDQNALREGLLREDVFVVVHETHWTETLEYADVVLPAPTYLEKDDVVLPYSHGYVKLSR